MEKVLINLDNDIDYNIIKKANDLLSYKTESKISVEDMLEMIEELTDMVEEKEDELNEFKSDIYENYDLQAKYPTYEYPLHEVV